LKQIGTCGKRREERENAKIIKLVKTILIIRNSLLSVVVIRPHLPISFNL